MPTTTKVQVDHRTVRLSNLGKMFYPAARFTKGQMLDYYARVAPVMVPHLRRRPVTLIRYPDGVEGPFFFEKECPRYRPPWMKIVPVERHEGGPPIHYCSLDDKASLVWSANQAAIEFHVLLSMYPAVDRPTSIALDLDPGPGMTILDCAATALQLKSTLEALGLSSFAKTSGKKGIHLYVPLNDPKVTFDDTKAFARALALHFENKYPDKIVSKMSKALRSNKIFMDWSQNDAHKTTCAVYSLRAAEQPTVSTPVTWKELQVAVQKKNPALLVFTSDTVLRRVQTKGDLFEPVLTLRQRLPPISALAAAASHPPAEPSALRLYHQKRHFDVTPEPRGGAPTGKGDPIFVIQKHAASHLHYDFRLEHEGVLLSWAVPKGPSTDPAVKRLAIHVEDHPMDYAGFEGIIPRGQYGGGTVMVWDKGTFVNLTNRHGKIVPLKDGFRKGHIDFWLKGSKLKGGWSLIQTHSNERQWLLVKMKDAGAHQPRNVTETKPDSALSGRSLEGIAANKKRRVWQSNRVG